MTLGSLAPVLTNELVQMIIGNMIFYPLQLSTDFSWVLPA
jgi:hypothetical protein